MKVEKAVGWILGQNGKGVTYELSHNGQYALANIWQDGKFHYLSIEAAREHVAIGKATLQDRGSYLPESSLPKNADGSLKVDNPDGWERLYTESGNAGGDTNETGETVISDNLEFPFSVSFEGKVKINIAGLSKILNLL